MIINNNENNRKYIKHIEKFTLLFTVFIFIIYELIIYFMNDTMLSSLYFNKKDYNVYSLQKTEKIYKSKLNEKCFPTKNKILWKNQTDLEIEKNKAEVLNSKSIKIKFDNINEFYKRDKPKISIIITIYNQERYIKSVYAHIQNQELKDIEIIFVDDASTDNSSSIIKELMIYDKRIVYLKNNINKKQFYSINKGVIKSKGEYILSVDPDDFLLNNILIKAYQTAKFYELDVLEYYILSHLSLWNVKYQSGIICGNSKVRNIFYYGNTRNLPDKLIKRSIFIKAINFMPKEIYNEDYQSHTDDTTFFAIIHFANSYGFLEQIGYFYNTSPYRKPKILLLKDKHSIANKEMKSLFNIMKYFIIKTDNNSIEKNLIAFRFFYDKVRKKLIKNLKYISSNFQFFLEVLDIYLNCSFFSEEAKNILLKYKRKIIIKKSYYK